MSDCKFKYGDKVIVNGHKAKVVSVFTKKASVYYCTVRFDDPKLIPQEMDFNQNEIEDQSVKPIKKEEVKCNCGTFAVYGKIPAAAHRSYCALQKKEEEPPLFKETTKEQDDLLEEFERMLSGWGDDDDDDDFGFYVP